METQVDYDTLSWKPNVMSGDFCPACKQAGGIDYADVGENQYYRCRCGHNWEWEGNE